MSRRDDEHLDDTLASADAIAAHLRRGGIEDGLLFDAVRVRLIEIGEAVKDIDPALLADEPDIPWRDVAGMRDHRPSVLRHGALDRRRHRRGGSSRCGGSGTAAAASARVES